MLPSIIHNNSMDTIFDSFFNDLGLFPKVTRRDRTYPIMPVDVLELDDKYTVTIDLPGIEKNDIEISLDNRTLTVVVKSKTKKEKTEGNYLYQERKLHNSFRKLTLPEDVNEENISAKLTSGVLSVDINKTTAPQPKKIEIL